MFYFVGILHAVIGGLFALLGLPLLLGKVRPNPWYGFRTEKTLSNPDIWYAVNRALGVDLLIGGLVLVGVALASLNWQRRHPEVPVTLVNLLALVLFAVLIALHGFKVLARYR